MELGDYDVTLKSVKLTENDISEFTVDGVDIAPSEELSVDMDETKVKVGNKFWYSTGLTQMKAFRGYFEFMDVLSSLEGASAREDDFWDEDME